MPSTFKLHTYWRAAVLQNRLVGTIPITGNTTTECGKMKRFMDHRVFVIWRNILEENKFNQDKRISCTSRCQNLLGGSQGSLYLLTLQKLGQICLRHLQWWKAGITHKIKTGNSHTGTNQQHNLWNITASILTMTMRVKNPIPCMPKSPIFLRLW